MSKRYISHRKRKRARRTKPTPVVIAEPTRKEKRTAVDRFFAVRGATRSATLDAAFDIDLPIKGVGFAGGRSPLPEHVVLLDGEGIPSDHLAVFDVDNKVIVTGETLQESVDKARGANVALTLNEIHDFAICNACPAEGPFNGETGCPFCSGPLRDFDPQNDDLPDGCRRWHEPGLPVYSPRQANKDTKVHPFIDGVPMCACGRRLKPDHIIGDDRAMTDTTNVCKAGIGELAFKTKLAEFDSDAREVSA